MNRHPLGGLMVAGAVPVAEPEFFPVSGLKLAALSITTFGLYELYWFYENWKRVRARERLDISPFWRAFFSWLFCYQIFRRLSEAGVRSQVTAFAPGRVAFAWVAIWSLWMLPGSYGLLATFSFVPLVYAQGTANLVNARVAPGSERNRRFSLLNLAVLVLGGALFVLAVVGAFVPESGDV